MDLAAEISNRYGFSELVLRPLKEGDQRLFDAEYQRHGQYGRAVVRAYPDWVERAHVEAEAEWLDSLAKDTDLLVPAPIRAIDGTYVQDLEFDPDSEVRAAVLQAWVPGELLAENVTFELIREIGRNLACLHNHSELKFDRDGFASQRKAFEVWVEDWSDANEVTPCAEEVLKKAPVAVTARFESISEPSDASGFIHADPHPWNILVDGDRISVIDFSDCGWGPYVYDIASALVYYKYPQVWDEEPQFDYDDLEAALLDGYTSKRRLPANFEQALPICLAARLLLLVEVILDEPEQFSGDRWTRKALANSIGILKESCG